MLSSAAETRRLRRSLPMSATIAARLNISSAAIAQIASAAIVGAAVIHAITRAGAISPSRSTAMPPPRVMASIALRQLRLSIADKKTRSIAARVFAQG